MIIFTEEEMKWIIKEPFNWHIDENCPEELREQIQRKMNILNKESE